jgi:hypothetical protein
MLIAVSENVSRLADLFAGHRCKIKISVAKPEAQRAASLQYVEPKSQHYAAPAPPTPDVQHKLIIKLSLIDTVSQFVLTF